MKNSMNSGVSSTLRRLVFEREAYTCAVCDNPANDLHHVTPRREGGKSVADNVIALCRLCHLKIHREEYLCPDEFDELEVAIVAYLADYYAEEHERDGDNEIHHCSYCAHAEPMPNNSSCLHCKKLGWLTRTYSAACKDFVNTQE